ncbi:MAG: DUF6125 family protein [Dehalococcoidia bacterium]|nr:DUF6125 family protein [Dehalococcoidia bacterium]
MPELDQSQILTEKLLELCSRSLYTVDGLWFTTVEQKYGLDVAIEMDVEVWRRLGLIQAKRMVNTFDIKKDSPIQAVISVLQVDPVLFIFKPQVVELTDGRAILRCTDCPPQKARIRGGKGEFPCKPVGLAIFGSYAEVIDPKIKLSCLTCPPDAHPPQYWCEWQFEI